MGDFVDLATAVTALGLNSVNGWKSVDHKN